MNPILAREMCLRWRDRRSFVLLFGLTAILALGLVWIYVQQSDSIFKLNGEAVGSELTRLSREL